SDSARADAGTVRRATGELARTRLDGIDVGALRDHSSTARRSHRRRLRRDAALPDFGRAALLSMAADPRLAARDFTILQPRPIYSALRSAVLRGRCRDRRAGPRPPDSGL